MSEEISSPLPVSGGVASPSEPGWVNLTCPHCGHEHDSVDTGICVGWIGFCVACGGLGAIADHGRFTRVLVFDLVAMPARQAARILEWQQAQIADVLRARHITRRYRIS